MGTQVMIDLLGSAIIGGIILLTMNQVQGRAVDQSGFYSVTRITQKNLVSIARIVEYDFRKMGYGVIDPTKSIFQADTSSITFLGDYNRNGKMDTIKYWLGPTSDLLRTPNPIDRILYRKINHESPYKLDYGVTRFRLAYFNQDMQTVTLLAAIKVVEIKIEVQSQYPLYNDNQEVANTNQKDFYPTVFWKQTRLTSRNLNR
jgi:hypothetical protein